MVKDPYLIFGIGEEATREQYEAKYAELKAKFAEQRFMDGEVGNEGAKLLSELEESWSLIVKRFDHCDESGTVDYTYIDEMIKSDKLGEAQNELDMAIVKNATWHYLQSILYYKRDWLTECKNELAKARELDPSNVKYKEAWDKLVLVMGSASIQPEKLNQSPDTPMPRTATCLGDICTSLCCAELCCSLGRCM